jgi:hypothetical protein
MLDKTMQFEIQFSDELINSKIIRLLNYAEDIG